MNANVEKNNQRLPTFIDYQHTSPKDKVMSHKIPVRLWESITADIFTINNKHYLCTLPLEIPSHETGGGIQQR